MTYAQRFRYAIFNIVLPTLYPKENSMRTYYFCPYCSTCLETNVISGSANENPYHLDSLSQLIERHHETCTKEKPMTTSNPYPELVNMLISKITSRIETLESRKKHNIEHVIPDCRDINDSKLEELYGILHFLSSFKGENTPK